MTKYYNAINVTALERPPEQHYAQYAAQSATDSTMTAKTTGGKIPRDQPDEGIDSYGGKTEKRKV